MTPIKPLFRPFKLHGVTISYFDPNTVITDHIELPQLVFTAIGGELVACYIALDLNLVVLASCVKMSTQDLIDVVAKEFTEHFHTETGRTVEFEPLGLNKALLGGFVIPDKVRVMKFDKSTIHSSCGGRALTLFLGLGANWRLKANRHSTCAHGNADTVWNKGILTYLGESNLFSVFNIDHLNYAIKIDPTLFALSIKEKLRQTFLQIDSDPEVTFIDGNGLGKTMNMVIEEDTVS
jgi:hypothetical protein